MMLEKQLKIIFDFAYIVSIYILFDESNERYNSMPIGWFETSQ